MRLRVASLITLSACLAVAVPAQAATVLSDNFDGEAAATGGTQTNYNAYANFNVSDGTVDQIRQPAFGLGCAGGSGGCVDLDGSSNNGGTLTTKLSYGFNAGDIVTLSFLLSGNQRGGAADEFSYGFNTAAATLFNNVIVTGAFGPAPANIGNLGPGLFLGSGRPNGSLGLVAPNEGYAPYSIQFTAGNAGNLTAFVATASADNVGPMLDNFLLDITPGAVPEPSTWAMMLLGFGAIGAMLRRRKTAIRFAV